MGEVVSIKDFQREDIWLEITLEDIPELMEAMNRTAAEILEGKSIGQVIAVDTNLGKFKIILEKYDLEDGVEEE